MEIIAAMVALTLKPSNVSRIMHCVNTSQSGIRRYLKFIIKKGLVNKVARRKNERIFKATDKGVIFFKKYCDIPIF